MTLYSVHSAMTSLHISINAVKLKTDLGSIKIQGLWYIVNVLRALLGEV